MAEQVCYRIAGHFTAEFCWNRAGRPANICKDRWNLPCSCEGSHGLQSLRERRSANPRKRVTSRIANGDALPWPVRGSRENRADRSGAALPRAAPKGQP
ncbi:hypothetical protein Ga0080559_TMP3169 [Salipiger profundus]|uniref:Uncharacterized protein n=1 Tax=Salipiger profundus TaxID=1229727 RepID=A0A1U7D7B8_9RHOB|nr:hypothetical protein Ga0080559_TMP3169 [Salipiger profundus]